MVTFQMPMPNLASYGVIFAGNFRKFSEKTLYQWFKLTIFVMTLHATKSY